MLFVSQCRVDVLSQYPDLRDVSKKGHGLYCECCKKNYSARHCSMQRVVLEHTVMVRCTCKIHEIIGFFQLQYSTFTVICHSVFSRDNGPCLFLGAHIWPLAALYICHEFPSSYMFSLTLPPQDTAGNNRSVGLTFLYQKLMASVMISVNWPGYVKCAHTVPFSVLFLRFCLHTIM